MKFFRSASRIFLAALIVASSLPPIVGAQQAHQTTPGQALEIAPPVLNLKGDPGQTVTSNIGLRSISASTLIVANEINDFTANGEDGTPKILIEGETSAYSMKDWFAPIPQQKLKSRELKQIPISIKIPKNASPGGYFSVVRFTPSAPELDGSGVSLVGSLGALVFLRVSGTAKEQVAIEQVNTVDKDKPSSLFQAQPIKFILRLKNTGNLQEQPRGEAAITDMFGKPVTTLSFNADNKTILPETIRKFEDSLDNSKIGGRILFGKYTAKLTVTYGNNQTVTKTLDFWVIPYTLIAVAIVGLVILFFVLRFLIKRYNRHIIKQAAKK